MLFYRKEEGDSSSGNEEFCRHTMDKEKSMQFITDIFIKNNHNRIEQEIRNTAAELGIEVNEASIPDIADKAVFAMVYDLCHCKLMDKDVSVAALVKNRMKEVLIEE